jgi:hypothetical protein
MRLGNRVPERKRDERPAGENTGIADEELLG